MISAVDAINQTELVLKIDVLSPSEREEAAEKLLRRRGIPGPATEHAIQHLVGIWQEFLQDEPNTGAAC